MNSPDHLAKFDGMAPLSRYSLLGLEVLYTGSQPNFRDQHISSSFLTNLTMSTPSLHNGWELSGGFYNLFDRRWSTPTGPEIAAPATVQDGHSFRFRISYRWSKEKQWR
jgi:outer membrane receptor protein involved in Fe transport